MKKIFSLILTMGISALTQAATMETELNKVISNAITEKRVVGTVVIVSKMERLFTARPMDLMTKKIKRG